VNRKEKALYKKAMALTRGSYQEDLITGVQSWSGASLKGKAKSWGKHYCKSRTALLDRLEMNRIAYLTKVKHGRIKLVFGSPPTFYIEVAINCGQAWIPGYKTVLDEIIEAVDNSKTHKIST
jgi:hypothetical protein